MKYLRSTHFIIHLMALWWVLWLAVSNTALNHYRPPTWQVTLQFAGFVLLFLTGHALARLFSRAYPASKAPEQATVQPFPFRLRRTLLAMNVLSLCLLLFSLRLSGAFTEDFLDYYFKLRGNDLTAESPTGSRVLDVATKVILFPTSYTLTAVVLAAGIHAQRVTLALSIVNMLLFSYLWQINYPIIHLFWFFIFYLLVGTARGSPPDRKTLLFVASVLALLVASAANRFGGDVLGGLQRYVVGYHLAGFSFYDHHYNNPSSLLHTHSFGRSSLGFLEQILEVISRRIDLGFVAASSENSTHNDESVELGATEINEGNAFGTFLFGFYRDFNVVGIAAGALLYGAFTTRLATRGATHWPSGAVFYVLASSWMVGMMVNPIEQAHFWFSILFIGMLSILNRGIKL